MPGKTKRPAPPRKSVAKKAEEKKTIFVKKAKNFSIGGDIQPQRDLGRFVKWPKYVRLQRQKQVLMKRLKIPPSINQFNLALDKNTATQLFRLLHKYRPENKAQKKERLTKLAAARAENKDADAGPKPLTIKYGINHITGLVEQKKAKLVVIAHDVDPIEIVIWLPALCRKMGVPYCIVKGKSRLGSLVHKKTATAIALTEVQKEDQSSFSKIIESVTLNFNEQFDTVRRRWGGGILGGKTMVKLARQERERRREEAARLG